jgi:hypothetical protein
MEFKRGEILKRLHLMVLVFKTFSFYNISLIICFIIMGALTRA